MAQHTVPAHGVCEGSSDGVSVLFQSNTVADKRVKQWRWGGRDMMGTYTSPISLCNRKKKLFFCFSVTALVMMMDALMSVPTRRGIIAKTSSAWPGLK